MKEVWNKAKGWRTVIFGGGVVALGTAAEVLSYLDAAPLEGYLPAWTTILIGVGAIVLRQYTTTPLGKK